MELVLRLGSAVFKNQAEKSLLYAKAQLSFCSPAGLQKKSDPFHFHVPLGLPELESLRWYLEQYPEWPFSWYEKRAKQIEARLEEWGRALHKNLTEIDSAASIYSAWQEMAFRAEEPRFTIEQKLENSDQEAAIHLLALPWELISDGNSSMIYRHNPVQFRRTLSLAVDAEGARISGPVRLLIISPRPEQEGISFIGPRHSLKPMLTIFNSLGDLAEVTILVPPTLEALRAEVAVANQAGRPFHIIHFDGHGGWSPKVSKGYLCFEASGQTGVLHRRKAEWVSADNFAQALGQSMPQLIFLEACQTGRFNNDPFSSVATHLVEAKCPSVIAMTQSVQVSATKMFTETFYRNLVQGDSIGRALAKGQAVLAKNPIRAEVPGFGELRLTDWFIPSLFQLKGNLPLFPNSHFMTDQRVLSETRRAALLPSPVTGFEGRQQELLALERLFQGGSRYGVILGPIGIGKTALALEFASWLFEIRQIYNFIYIPVQEKDIPDEPISKVMWDLIVEGWNCQSAELVKKQLSEIMSGIVMVVFDGFGRIPIKRRTRIALCLRRMLDSIPQIRLLITSFTPPPPPFDGEHEAISLGQLADYEAINIVNRIINLAQFEVGSLGEMREEIVDILRYGNGNPAAIKLMAEALANATPSVFCGRTRIVEIMESTSHEERLNEWFAKTKEALAQLPKDIEGEAQLLLPFQKVVSTPALAVMYKLKGFDSPNEKAGRLLWELTKVGLVQPIVYSVHYLEPSLTFFLGRELCERGQLDLHHAEAMLPLVAYLEEGLLRDMEKAQIHIYLERFNLLTMIRTFSENDPFNLAALLVTKVERYFATANLGNLLPELVVIREKFRVSGNWDSDQFEATTAQIWQLFEAGNLSMAARLVLQLLRNSEKAGPKAYPGADFDLASAFLDAGRILGVNGQEQKALECLDESIKRYQVLTGKTQNRLLAAYGEKANILLCIGRVSEAEELCLKVGLESDELCDGPSSLVAVSLLARIRMSQSRWDEALDLLEKERVLSVEWKLLKEYGINQHNMALCNIRQQKYEQAEIAIRESIKIKNQMNDVRGEGASLSLLGTLLAESGQYEEAMDVFKEALALIEKCGNFKESLNIHANLAKIYIRKREFNTARAELKTALNLAGKHGFQAEPWILWDLLYQVEGESGNQKASLRARSQAIKTYGAYRMQGGQTHNPRWGQIAMIASLARMDRKVESTWKNMLSNDFFDPLVLLKAKHPGELMPNYMDVVEKQILEQAPEVFWAGRNLDPTSKP